jgi:proteasome accessory factor A
VAITKICGIETEFGIVHRGVADPNPITASSLLINAYVNQLRRDAPDAVTPRAGWDFEDETPGNDARGATQAGAYAPEVETNLVNCVLTNGARYYVDHAHPELSTPECADALAVVCYDRAAEEIARRSMQAALDVLGPGQSLVVYKNNSDRKGNSYGCHENYLMDRAVPFGRIVVAATAHFITRQIFTGAGKVGNEAGLRPDQVPFQLTQRADFFEEEVGLETTLKRPIVNTRDEPHCDATRYRRLHVITGDANLSEVATFLKVGTTAIALAMIEDEAWPRDFVFAAPVAAMRAVSYDLTLRQPLTLADGSTITALEVQGELLAAAKAWAEREGLDTVGGAVGRQVLDRWEAVLTAFEVGPESLADQLDWVAKHRLLDGYRRRHDLSWDDARLAAMDLQYHDLRPEKSLAARVGLQTLVSPDAVRSAMTTPPEDTRAYFRGTCLARWPNDVVAANWDSLVFDIGTAPLRRVPMMEPARGTRAQVGELLASVDTPAELIAALSA